MYGYYNVLHQIIENYGIPVALYTDKRTVFEYKKKNSNAIDKDNHTQFSYACHQLGIEIKTTSVAQVKGLVEKYNDTFQSRLPIELRIAGINNIDDANKFLIKYIQKFNEKFAHQVNNIKNAFERQEDMELIKYILVVIDKRIVKNDHSIKFNNNSYFLIDEDSNRQYIKASY